MVYWCSRLLRRRRRRQSLYSGCNTQNNIAIERNTVQWLIFSVTVWTSTLQTSSGCKDSINNGTKTQHSHQQTNFNGKLIRPLQRNNRNKQRSLTDNTDHNSTRQLYRARSYDNTPTPTEQQQRRTPTLSVNIQNPITPTKTRW